MQTSGLSDLSQLLAVLPLYMHWGAQVGDKIAFVSGSTDGIGRATAVELARRDFTVHLLGRNEKRGKNTLAQLTKISSGKPHKLFLIDLASIRESKRVLEGYTSCNSRLNLLIVNAKARIGKRSLSEDRIETTFAVGCLSRYMFSVMLSPLLKTVEGSRVMHIGDATSVAAVDYAAISGDALGVARATYQSYSADALLAYWFNESGMTEVPYEIMSPGSVNTRQLPERRFFPKIILRLLSVIDRRSAFVSWPSKFCPQMRLILLAGF